MINIKKIFAIAAFGLIGTLAALYVLSLEVPYTIKTPCYFSAHEEWSLIQPRPEVLMTRLTAHNPPSIHDVRLMQFERDDFFSFSLAESVYTGKPVLKNELIGTIQSSDNQISLEELTGEFNVARANLDFLLSGEKVSIQEEALEETKRAQTELAAFEPVLSRKRDLLDRELISAEELELAEANHRLLSLNISIAEARLKTARTGERPEEIEVVKAQITDIETQLATIQHKLSALNITSPIHGVMMGAPSADATVMFTISNLDTLVVQAPVDEMKIRYLSVGTPIRIKVPAAEESELTGQIGSIDKHPVMVNGRTMFITRTNIVNKNKSLIPGMTGSVVIYCDTMKVSGLIKRWLKESSNKTFSL